jgi:Fur family transcriptional regulator, ferric uptake regulator
MTTHAASDLLATLEDHGQRMTGQRVLLAKYLESKEEAFSAEQIRADLPGVGRATIYRTLKILVDAGVLCKTQLPDGSPRYKRDDPVHHHHVVCTTCGKVSEFRHPSVERMLRAMQDDVPGTVVGHRLEIFITCDECLRKSPAQQQT